MIPHAAATPPPNDHLDTSYPHCHMASSSPSSMSSQTTGSALLALPREIRLRILEYVFEGATLYLKPVIVNPSTEPGQPQAEVRYYPDPGRVRPESTKSSLQSAVLQVCRALRHEAAPVQEAKVTIVLGRQGPRQPGSKSQKLLSRPGINPLRFRRFTKLVVTSIHSCAYKGIQGFLPHLTCVKFTDIYTFLCWSAAHHPDQFRRLYNLPQNTRLSVERGVQGASTRPDYDNVSRKAFHAVNPKTN